MVSRTEIIRFLKSKGIYKLYHFTDRTNLQSIYDHYGLWSWSDCGRQGIIVEKPGGSDLSHKLDKHHGLDMYVRLSFIKDHPMMYSAIAEERIDDPIILEIDLNILLECEMMFSDSNAASNDFITGSSVGFLKEFVDFNLFSEKYFDLDDDERKSYQAEILIKGCVPLKYITNIRQFVKTESVAVIEKENQKENKNTTGLGIKYQTIVVDGREFKLPIIPDDIIDKNNILLNKDIIISPPTVPISDKPKGVIPMMVLFIIFCVIWISFCIYCFIFKWTNSQWYDYIWGVLLMIFGTIPCVGLPWYTLYWILSKTGIVDKLD